MKPPRKSKANLGKVVDAQGVPLNATFQGGEIVFRKKHSRTVIRITIQETLDHAVALASEPLFNYPKKTCQTSTT